MKAFGHFKTITRHKLMVMGLCFRVGLIRQGLLHDLSKYSWTEFRIGAKYYSGTHSPNASERDEIGYSTAWLHHKGRNKHHLEYWMDYGIPNSQMAAQPMPTKYMVEMCLDRIAACKVYQGSSYTDRSPLEYLDRSLDANFMHPITRSQTVEILSMLAQRGEKETLRYIRRVVLRNPVECYSNLSHALEHPERKDDTFLSGARIKMLARELGTPFYLYSRERIEDACRTLQEAFSWNAGHRQFFPVKATPTPGILRLLRKQGQGVVCSSAAELELCRRSGFSPEEILFMPNYPTKEDLDTAAELKCLVMLDGPGLVEDYAMRGILRDGIGLRINPGGVFRFGTAEVRLKQSKFGFTPEQARKCIAELQKRGIRSIGIHSYLCGNTLDPEYYPAAAEKLLTMALELAEETGIQIAYVNLSGGLGIPYRPGDQPLDLHAIGTRVRAVYESVCHGTALAAVPLYTELGRWITGPAGILVTRVNHVRHGFCNIAGVDASASNLMRPMMYGAYHHITAVEKDGPRAAWDVVGTVCENTDKFAAGRQLPALSVGDLLVIHDTGAHGHSMGYQYGGRLRCGEYLLDKDGSVAMIRRPETTEDYLSTAVF